MGDLSFARYFQLRPGRIECDAGGLRVGGVALLARDAKGAWTRRDERDLNRELSKLYGFPLDFGRKRRRIDAVAAALGNGELARAQIAALLLQLPDPPASAGSPTRRVGKTASRPRPRRLRTSESGRRLGREAPENGRAAESRLVRAKTWGAGGGRAEDRPGPRGRRAVPRRRGARLCSPRAGGRRWFAARRRLVRDRPARARDVGRSPIRRDDPVRRDLRAERQRGSSRRAPSPVVPT